MIEFIAKVKNALAGKKAYLTAIGALITAAVAWSGSDLTDTEFVVAVFACLQTCWIRAAIKKGELT